MLTDRDIAGVFDATFASADTCLLGGARTPYYVPASRPAEPSRVFYTLDYAASALHEAAHWLRAGSARRRLPDYGYWYVDEPRPASVQRAFLSVEADVQALECVLSEAAGREFRVSVDDFTMPSTDIQAFERRVRTRAQQLCERGLPGQSRRFVAALQDAIAKKVA